MGQCKKLAIELNLYEEGKDLKEVLNHKEMHKAILNNFLELAKHNKLSGLEKIKKIYISADPWTIDNDILTPTMKVKRNIAKNVFKKEIDEMYADAE
jgi:long-chain acyl-CoA synthetase